MLNFDNASCVSSLKAKLISISQLYDKSYKINFSKETCMVVDKNGKIVIKTQCTSNNFYETLT